MTSSIVMDVVIGAVLVAVIGFVSSWYSYRALVRELSATIPSSFAVRWRPRAARSPIGQGRILCFGSKGRVDLSADDVSVYLVGHSSVARLIGFPSFVIPRALIESSGRDGSSAILRLADAKIQLLDYSGASPEILQRTAQY
jgi:hypothetical protein